ncbi:MAG: NACHT domain-containing NTPase [Richelia sp. RM2_1_2]|nr:NACHT domain-containing NTPase [Richelia sp. RM2_1_2]
MLTPDEIKVILEKLAAGNATDEEIKAISKGWEGNETITVQVAKYINNFSQVENSQFGDSFTNNKANQSKKLDQSQFSINQLVQQVRLRFHDDIQRLHGTMPLLGVDHCVDLGELFVDVNILKQVSSNRKSELDELWQDFNACIDKNSNYRSLERIGLGKHQKRVSGSEVLAKDSNLMVVGKPGSGKTTYLQHIVTECNQGRLQADKIPVLIKLRQFVNDGRRFEYNLKDYLTQQWRLSEAEIELLLSQGKVLILLDGLDEVVGEDGNKIVKKTKQFARTYPQNKLIITCRTQSQESKFEGFDYVEIADFNEVQVKAFAKHWFNAVCSSKSEAQEKVKEFLEKLYLDENKQIRELAITPILLTLTCAVFYQTRKFYSKRSKLYEEGLELLLENWDKSREIERDEIYRDLSVERKQELLSYLAVKKFEKQQYVLFEQEEIEGYIAEFLDISLRESRVVLKAIEAQHGLVIERARKVWSFSHLTFQEYLVARNIIKSIYLHQLSVYIVKRHWREVFILILEITNYPDEVIQLIKKNTDELLAKNKGIQQFLDYIQQAVNYMDTPYKPAAIRALYIGYDKEFLKSLTPKLDSNLANDYYYAVELCDDIEFDLGHNLDDYTTPKEMSIASQISNSIKFAIARSIIFDAEIRNTLRDLRNLSFSSKVNSNEVFEQNLDNNCEESWEEIWLAWRENLCNVIDEYDSWIHDWEFGEEEEELLQDYYYANKFIVDCLNSNLNISPIVRQEIEDTLLLPIAEREQRKREK